MVGQEKGSPMFWQVITPVIVFLFGWNMRGLAYYIIERKVKNNLENDETVECKKQLLSDETLYDMTALNEDEEWVRDYGQV
jgi:hypothetical protein